MEVNSLINNLWPKKKSQGKSEYFKSTMKIQHIWDVAKAQLRGKYIISFLILEKKRRGGEINYLNFHLK